MSFLKLQRMVSYLTMEDELLCDAWLVVSVDFIGRGRGTFWQQVHESFHSRKHIAPYDTHIIHDCNVRSLLFRWYVVDQRRQVMWRGIVHGIQRDRKFCFFFLNLLID